MADAYKPGQRVRHTSKMGPFMAIVGYGEFGIAGDEHKALCKWFDEKTRKFEQDTFFDHELEAMSEPAATAPSRRVSHSSYLGRTDGWLAR